ncbi:putative bifunctional diguanylate cyclase/phosphodiesterase [Aquabacter cavernae]|uniref:putative bifunctional diguanylate cyclase/phosphodiesterase n=1 Tax=Aquabacter cavernae TaxID=2496029 RepID=UPI001FDFCEBA|nr:EAL domain-containing protein [Aquabacter cavernae]
MAGNDRRVVARERDAVFALLEERAAAVQRSASALLEEGDTIGRAVSGEFAFVHERFGRPLDAHFGYERAYLVDRSSGKPVYASIDGALLNEEEMAAAAPTLRRALRGIGERSMGLIVDDRGVGLAVIVPPLAGAPGLLCIAVDAVDDAFLKEMEQRLQVSGLHVMPAREPSRGGEDGVVLTNLAGDAPLVMSWRTQSAGIGTLTDVAPVIAALSSALLGICLAFLVRAHRSARALAESEARASSLAYRDNLTGLSNRGRFISLLEQRLAAMKNQDALALLFLDLDDFKDINDTLGHVVGDELLCEIARRLEAAVGEAGNAGRFGGDEFVAFIAAPAAAALDAHVARVTGAVHAPVLVDGRELMVGASVGVAYAPRHAATARDLMRRADIALYRAKAEGRGSFAAFEPPMEVETLHRRKVEQELAEAILHDQLTLLYQPLVDVESERILGFEALVRWDHPEHGRLLPEAFIPVAERSRLISRLDSWVLRAACEAGRTLPDVTLSVNMSAINLRDPDLSERVLAVLEETGFDPARLEIEITESALFTAEGPGRETLVRLRDVGIRIALDDFGTGHASLVHIRSVPVTKIKIDRSFILNLGIERDAAAIVEYVIRLGRSLGIILTAEGVETREQLRFLRAFGAQQAQGYLFSPPVPIETARRFLDEQRVAVPAQGANRRLPERTDTASASDKEPAGTS